MKSYSFAAPRETLSAFASKKAGRQQAMPGCEPFQIWRVSSRQKESSEL